MAGDYTRLTFDPRRDHAGVLMQQGRVTLDADWNELVDLVDRRLRAETIDIIGRCVVPRETPDGFNIVVSGGKLTIGRGRAYVHGILAECHGSDPKIFDAVLGEERGTGAIAYEDQPYLPNAAAVAPLPKEGTYLAYLDVWRREVTALEEPVLVEKAIGIETATRLQTAWQVRLLQVPQGTTCGADLAEWNDLTAPSAGRLTTKAVGVPVDDDPCTVPPTGGYRGTENRLYRIELHDPGPLGTATFKWSRDNASIAFAVTGLDTARTKLNVTRVGRDSVARISIGDWVEVTDDWRELNSLPGEMRKVAGVDDGDETITLAGALPAGAFDPLDADRHMRVTRWDQTGVAVDAAGGVMKVPTSAGTAIVLEDGVQISFDVDPSAGSFHVGDYWVFAARTADASVEELVEAPPKGILHHFCQLAVVTFPTGAVDCRTFWPPDFGDGHDCSCDACVTPRSHASGELTIQMAVDQLKGKGGRICLAAGFYYLDEAVRITGSQSLTIVGKGWRTILVSAGRQPAIVVQASLGVTIDSLTILTSSLAAPGALPSGIAIGLRNTIGTTIERCVLAQVGSIKGGTDTTNTLTHVQPAGTNLAVGPQAAGAPLIALDGFVVETAIRDDVLIGTTGVGSVWGALHTELDFTSMSTGLDERMRSAAATEEAQGSGYLLTYDLVIEDNLFVCFLNGVSLEGFTINVGNTAILRNSVLGGLRAGMIVNGLTLPAMSRVDLTGNLLQVFGFGIAIGTDDTRVADNDVFGLIMRGANLSGNTIEGFAALRRGDGIVLTPSVRPSGIDRCQVRGNRIGRVLGHAISVRTEVVSAQISQNTIQGVGGSGVTTEQGSASVLRVSENQILDVGVLPQPGFRSGGILLTSGEDVAAVGNTVHGVRGGAPSGILSRDCRRVRIAGNDVADIGDDQVAEAYGIVGSGGRVDILGNTVRRASDALAKPSTDSTWFGIWMIGEEPTTKLEAQPALALAGNFARAIVQPAGDTAIIVDPARGRVVIVPRGKSSIAVEGNLVEAVSRDNAVYLQNEGSCIFSDNRCFLTARSDSTATVVQIRTEAAVVSDNYLEGAEKIAALDLVVPTGAGFTVSGNVSSGPIALNHTQPLPSPWDQLNVP